MRSKENSVRFIDRTLGDRRDVIGMTRLRLLCTPGLPRRPRFSPFPASSFFFFPDILHIHARAVCRSVRPFVHPFIRIRMSVRPLARPSARSRVLRRRTHTRVHMESTKHRPVCMYMRDSVNRVSPLSVWAKQHTTYIHAYMSMGAVWAPYIR